MTSGEDEFPTPRAAVSLSAEELGMIARQGPGGVIFERPPEVAAKAPPVAMTVLVPAELSHLVPDIKRFVDAMVYKLRKNKRKGKWETYSILDTLELLRGEVAELAEAIEDGNDFETILEAADIGNFAMIAASIAIEGRKR